MNKKFCIFSWLLGAIWAMPVDAINVSTGARAWWGYDGGTATNGSAGDFIIAGNLGKSGPHGTFDDEWGVVGLVAEKIVEHGGYFCPYQIQCANKRKKKKSWTTYYAPKGFKTSQCAWLCESGYSGVNCLTQTATPSRCDKTPMNTGTGGKFAGLAIKTSGGNSDGKESYITGFNQWGSNPEYDVVLGIVKYLEHGVMAGPVQIKCGRDNWKNIDSFVESVLMATGDIKLLCAEGYTADANGADCIPVNHDRCETQEMTFCAGFDRAKYDSNIHTIESTGGCVKYFCTEPDMAFASNMDTTCVECSTGVKGGSSTANGTCVKCSTGQYFDKNSNSCKQARAYSKSDLQYGKGQTKNTQSDFNKQCWTYVMPEEYVACVESGGQTTRTSN